MGPKPPVTETAEPFTPPEEHVLILVPCIEDISEKDIDLVDFVFGHVLGGTLFKGFLKVIL